MNKPRTKLYMKVNLETKEIIYTGISFAEFQQYLLQPIENLILLRGDYEGNRQNYNLQLVEGDSEIVGLTKENIYRFGDFHFVDYVTAGAEAKISEQQVAELLYMSHMWKPLQSPFLEQLKNRFAYLAHDDGWYCKLFCNNLNEFMYVFLQKIITNVAISEIKKTIGIEDQLLDLATSGLMVDLEEVDGTKNSWRIALYVIGPYSNMDDVLNNVEMLKETASQVVHLRYHKGKYNFSN